MKLIYWLAMAGILFLLPQTGVAQDSDSPLSWGLRIGGIVGAPIPVTVDPDSTSGKLGLSYHSGAWVEYELSPKLSLRADLHLNRKNASYTSLNYWSSRDTEVEIFAGVKDTIPVEVLANTSGKMGLSYFELPLQLQYSLSDRIQVSLGPQIGYLLGGSDAGEVEAEIGKDAFYGIRKEPFDNINDINRFDYGILAGVMYSFNDKWAVDMRITRSLRPLYKEGFFESQSLPENPLFLSYMQLGVGYRIN